MRNSTRNIFALSLALGAGMTAVSARAGAQSPAPSSAPSPAASPGASAAPASPAKASAAPVSRTAIVTCRLAPFFSWPDQTQEPSGSSYPAARQGDAIGVIGTGTLTHTGGNLTETTIDVVQPYGFGKHYWIRTECIT